MSQGAPGITDLARRCQLVRRRIEAATQRSQRSAAEVTLVAVTKTYPPETLRRALALEITDLGENRVQEAEGKIVELGRSAAHWHFIGHLQANKVRRAVNLFDMIHSVDSAELAERLNRVCLAEGRTILPVLIQVDLAGEATKSGIPEKELAALAETVATSDCLQLRGLMTVPPFLADPQAVRPFFQRLRELRDSLQAKGCFGDRAGELSMGMSHDFEIAIEEGATMIRVGTAIFGERAPAPAS